MADKKESGDGKLKSPLYSNGTPDMDIKRPTMDSVSGPKGGKSVPNPLGYKTGGE